MSVFTLPSGVGYGALFFSLTFGFLSFAGFEGASTMGEETANPTKAIPLAIFGCVVFAGLFYVVVSMAESMGFGTDAAGVTAFTSSGNLMGDLAKTYVGSWVGRRDHPRRCFQRAQLVPGERHRRLAAAVCVLPRRSIRRHARPHLPTHGAPTAALIALMGVVAIEVFGSAAVRDHERHRRLLLDGDHGHAGTAGLLRDLDPRRHALPVLQQGQAVAQWEIVIPIAAVLFLGYTLYHNVYPVPAWPYNLFPYIVAAWVLLAVAAVYLIPGFARQIGDRLREEDGLSFPGSEIEAEAS